MKLLEKYNFGFSLNQVLTQDEIIEHEKMLYKAFYDKYPWYAKMCFNVNEDRLIPKIPFEDQLVFHILDTNSLIALGFSFCINPEQIFNIEMMGFKIQKNNSTSEALHTYSDLDSKYNKLQLINVGIKAAKYSEKVLKEKGFTKVYSSCEKNYVNSYKILGFKAIDEIKINNNSEILLFKEIK